MGTIIERPRKGGGVGYHAQIVIQQGGVTHRETQTFSRRPAAKAWIKMREDELRKPGAVAAARVASKSSDPTLKDAIDKYTKESLKEIGRTKAQVLRSIRKYEIADMPCSEIASADIVAFAQDLSDGRKPQTVGTYLSHLGSLFSIAMPAWRYPLDPAQMESAQKVTKRLGVISKSAERSRRPTLDELDKLMEHFQAVHHRRPRTVPMHRVVAFAVFSTRRQEEITRIAWSDLDEDDSRILVRDMKHPGQKQGNDVWCEMTPEALAIALAMPRSGARIFPYGTDAISASFTRACKFLEIKDLTFHDLRHEGISRLFEMGRTLPMAASVSAHRSWQSLKRYTHIRQTGDKYAGWPWLAVVTKPPNHIAADTPSEPPRRTRQSTSPDR